MMSMLLTLYKWGGKCVVRRQDDDDVLIFAGLCCVTIDSNNTNSRGGFYFECVPLCFNKPELQIRQTKPTRALIVYRQDTTKIMYFFLMLMSRFARKQDLHNIVAAVHGTNANYSTRYLKLYQQQQLQHILHFHKYVHKFYSPGRLEVLVTPLYPGILIHQDVDLSSRKHAPLDLEQDEKPPKIDKVCIMVHMYVHTFIINDNERTTSSSFLSCPSFGLVTNVSHSSISSPCFITQWYTTTTNQRSNHHYQQQQRNNHHHHHHLLVAENVKRCYTFVPSSYHVLPDFLKTSMHIKLNYTHQTATHFPQSL
ncbi:hypothetical protein FF38_10906 [Lucilia cuprina]|uniref:Uncharacterized protein n=1 Tax=Lucilia cuprina TaxID=7375 RepID=A0A0L0CPI8_LUCCU|nr:hypothetical protein FF38_10906 [Lucilia cuprina]